MAGTTNAQFAYEYLTAQGLSPGAAEGVVGNLVVESGVQPNGPLGDGGTAHGIAQWHPDRWNPFLAWARKAGRDPNSLEAQLFWLKKEAQTPAGGNVWSKLSGVNDPVQAAALWMRLFERPADQSDAAAQARAAAGVKAVQGAETLTAPGATPDNPDGTLPGYIGSNLPNVPDVGSAIQQATDKALKAIGPTLWKGLFVGLGVALVGVGIVKATGAGKGLGTIVQAAV